MVFFCNFLFFFFFFFYFSYNSTINTPTAAWLVFAGSFKLGDNFASNACCFSGAWLSLSICLFVDAAAGVGAVALVLVCFNYLWPINRLSMRSAGKMLLARSDTSISVLLNEVLSLWQDKFSLSLWWTVEWQMDATR